MQETGGPTTDGRLTMVDMRSHLLGSLHVSESVIHVGPIDGN